MSPIRRSSCSTSHLGELRNSIPLRSSSRSWAPRGSNATGDNIFCQQVPMESATKFGRIFHRSVWFWLLAPAAVLMESRTQRAWLAAAETMWGCCLEKWERLTSLGAFWGLLRICKDDSQNECDRNDLELWNKTLEAHCNAKDRFVVRT